MELFSLTKNITITDVQWQAYPIGFFLLLLCLLTVLGNILIIYAIIREQALHTSTHYYIASLAFADLMVGLVVMPLAFIFEMTDDEYWLFRRHLTFLCDYWHSMDVFASTASIFGLCTIGLDRYMAITRPIKYPNSFLSKRWYYVLPMIWICSAMLSFPPVVYFGTAQAISRQSAMANETTVTPAWLFRECDFPNNLYYILFISIVSFYVPLIVMIYVYIQVYLAARSQLRALHSGYKRHHRVKTAYSFLPKFRLRDTSSSNRTAVETSTTASNAGANVDEKSAALSEGRKTSTDSITLRIHYGKYQNPTDPLADDRKRPRRMSLHKSRRKRAQTNTFWRKFSKGQRAATFIGIIMGAFVVCWLPYFVYFMLSGVFLIRMKDDQHHELLFKIFSWLGYANSAVDVLVYVSTSRELRATVFRLFTPRRLRSAHRTS